MITKEKLNEITGYLKRHVFMNGDVMFSDGRWSDDDEGDLVDIIASLHNYLYEAVNGSRFDYWVHWANKISADVIEDFFNSEEYFVKKEIES